MKLLKHQVQFHYEQKYWPNQTNLNDLYFKFQDKEINHKQKPRL